MHSYIVSNLNDDISPDAFTVPGEVIDPASLVLADHRPNTSNCGAARLVASDRCMAIYQENGGEEMDFSHPKGPNPSRFAAVRRVYDRLACRLGRWWLWNVSYPIRMWHHFHFNREGALPEGRNALRSMLREAFVEQGVTDFDLPYPIYATKECST